MILWNRWKSRVSGAVSALDLVSGIVEHISIYLTITEINQFNFTSQYDIWFKKFFEFNFEKQSQVFALTSEGSFILHTVGK